jgi:hypothetical protein
MFIGWNENFSWSFGCCVIPRPTVDGIQQIPSFKNKKVKIQIQQNFKVYVKINFFIIFLKINQSKSSLIFKSS